MILGAHASLTWLCYPADGRACGLQARFALATGCFPGVWWFGRLHAGWLMIHPVLQVGPVAEAFGVTPTARLLSQAAALLLCGAFQVLLSPQSELL